MQGGWTSPGKVKYGERRGLPLQDTMRGRRGGGGGGELTHLKNLFLTSRSLVVLSPVLTVPVLPRYTPVKDSRYNVMNWDTFS